MLGCGGWVRVGLVGSYAEGEGLRSFAGGEGLRVVCRFRVVVARRKASWSFRLRLHSGLRQSGAHPSRKKTRDGWGTRRLVGTIADYAEKTGFQILADDLARDLDHRNPLSVPLCKRRHDKLGRDSCMAQRG